MISISEIKRIEDYTGIRTNYPVDRSIAGLFEEQVSLFPDNPAVFFKNNVITYRQLNEKADSLAAVLRNSGISTAMPVAVLTEKSAGTVIGILGILKAGGAYVPIDPVYPEERINYILKDSGCKYMITQKEFNDRHFSGITKILPDQIRGQGNCSEKMGKSTSSSDLAYIMYTSGTTGTPKGVMISNRGVVRLVKNTNYINITPSDRIAFINSVIFDASVFEIWSALLNGACLYIIDNETILDTDLLTEIFHKNEITIALFTSSFFNRLIELRGDLFSKLKFLLVGGEILSASHINLVRRLNPGLKVINVYGPTENTTFSTTFLIDKDYEQNIPIGKPVSNSTAYIFDDQMNYSPVGVTGELYVGGDGVSAGYLNRNDLNEKSFLEHPFKTGERLYRTGDQARWLPDGNIEFHGRKDNQIKIRGYRVELEEIESVISSLTGVVESVVKPILQGSEITGLVAFLNVSDTFNSDPEEIKKEIAKKLPRYMIPVAYKIMHGFPVTVTGKIDRKALRTDEVLLVNMDTTEEELMSETEAAICEIWKHSLKIDRIAVRDNFFDLGGSSLVALSIINRIKERTGCNLTYRNFILHPTISELASYTNSFNAEEENESVRLSHNVGLKGLLLSVNQRRIWLNCILQPESPAYNIPLTWKIKGIVYPDILRDSLDLLFRRHKIVFSIIRQENGEPLCDIVVRKVIVNNVDYTHINNKGQVIGFIDEDSRKTFDLERGPLFRLYLIKISEEEFFFHMTIHHIVFDGWSIQVFARELGEIYRSKLEGNEPDLKEIKFQQYDYACWEQDQEDQKGHEDLIGFWKDYLRDVTPGINFPYDFQRIGLASGKGEREIFSLSSEITEKLRIISRQEETTLFITLLSAFNILIHKYSGDKDFCIGLPVAYRPHAELEKIFGMFVNTIVFRNNFRNGQTFFSQIRRIKESFLDAYSHQELPFEKIVDAVNPDRIKNMNPLFQFCFAWQDNINLPLNLSGVHSERITGQGGTSPFDLTLYMWENEGILESEIEYSPDLFKRDSIVRLKDRFISLITHLAGDPDIIIDSLSLISDDEIRLIEEINNTYSDYPKDRNIPELFNEQVAKFPGNPALVFKGSSLTYEQLDRESDLLANTLFNEEMTADSPVGLLTDRSFETITGMLGILKSGAAYVPIDPDYPEQRIDFIIRDAGIRIMLAQKKYFEKVPASVKVICIDEQPILNKVHPDIGNKSGSSEMAYIMYTSGSTGTPKGSIINQKSVVRLVRNTNYINITPEDRILLTSSIAFDAATFEIWGTLLNGATLYIAEKDTILDPEALGKEIEKNGITILWLTSAFFTLIAEERGDIFGKLKYLLVGGDMLSPVHINKVRKLHQDLKLINCYGPTENTTFSTTYLIEKDYEYNIPIGKPISNSTTYIFDEYMNYQPVGVIGELYVGGDGVSRGYLNREDLNKKSFIEHPSRSGERLYRTGDLARWLPDGNIEFHGRKDNQVKIRGFRVELGEIESEISKIPGISEVVVKIQNEKDGMQRIVAFLNVTEKFYKEPDEITGVLKQHLPSYMIPSYYKIMRGFPLTVNGKTDRKALSFDHRDHETLSAQIQEGMTATEEKIHIIWKKILKNDRITSSDNFFDLGGNSLLAVSVISGIEKEFKVKLGTKVFFSNPRIKDLAEYIGILLKNPGSEFTGSGSDSRIIEGEI